MTYLSDGILSRLRALPVEPELSEGALGAEAAPERFVLDVKVGAGGMGEVFRGRDLESGRAVAIKLLETFGPDDYERFRREAGSLASLSHPAIVRYVAHGRLGERAFLAMEWLEGENLEARVESAGLTVAESVAICKRIAEALEVAHEVGIVHRDVKPSNVFLVEGEPERAKLIDFGIAHRLWAEQSLTAKGTIIGTPGYMAPEQARASEYIDARADVFALGCVLYRCLTGRRPFRGEDPVAVLTKTVFSDPPRPRQLVARVPAALDELVVRMLDKDPRRRPADVREVLDVLESLPAPDDDEPAPTSIAYPLLTRAERRLSSVLLIGPQRSSSAPSSRDPQWPLWRSTARAHGVLLEPLLDGSIAAVMTESSAARDSVLHMARAALALRPSMRAAPMVLVTGRGLVQRVTRGGEIVDRAARTLAELRIDPPRRAFSAVQIDRVTASLLRPHFEIGKSAGRWWLTGERAQSEQAAPSTPFVGREREIGELYSVFAGCTRQRQSAAALVIGAAGVGKTRLLQELVRRLESSPEPPTIWTGRGDVSRLGSPFVLLARALAHGLERASEPERRGRIARLLGELGDPDPLGERLLRGWLELVLDEAQARPLVLVLEDLQWADAPSLDFVARALRQSFDRPLVVIASARSDDPGCPKAPFGALGPIEVVLGGLSRKHSTELVNNVLGRKLPEARVREVVARADGNPFVLEELGRSVAEGRADLPETALALIEARLEALAPETRRVLRAASIFGESFWSDAVETLVDDVVVESVVEELVARSLVSHVTPTRLPPHAELAFRHSLIREAAYATLTPEDRVLGHRMAADWLERSGEPDPWPIAQHRRVAGQFDRAVEPYARAARAALDASDFPGVLVRVKHAFDCIQRAVGGKTDSSLRGRLSLMEAEARRWIGEPRAALDAAERALSCFSRGSEDWFRSVGELCAAAGRLGDYDQLAHLLDVAARTPVGSDRASTQIAALCPAAAQLLQAGRTEDAERLYAKIEEIAASARMDTLAGARLNQLRGFHWLHRDRPWLAQACFAHARDAFEALGSSKNAAIQAINLAHTAIEVGAFEEAEAALRDALRVGDLFGLSAVRAYASLNLGRLLAELGRYDEAEAAEATALELGMTEKSPRTTGAARVHLAAIALARGDPTLAEAEALAAAELLEVAPPLQAGALAVVARARLAQGKSQDALAPAEQARALVDAGQHEMFDALVRLVFAEVLRAIGKLEPARETIRGVADALLARAHEISDPDARARFLQRVTVHAQTLQLARELDA